MTKRIPLALATLAISAATQAQTNVTLYGVVDAAISFANAGNNASSQTRLDSAVGSGSRLGFRGNEDLGGGLKALYTMEMGLDASTGNFQQGGLPWGRQIFVGIGGKDWSLSLGRQYSPTLISMQSVDAFQQNYWGSSAGYGIGTLQSPASAAAAGSGCQGATVRINNSAQASYSAAGFTGRLMLGAGNEDSRRTGRYINPSLTYSAGSLMMTASYARLAQCAPDITATATPKWQDEATIGGTYDFKIAKLFAGYYLWNPSEDNRSSTPAFHKHQAYWLGTRVPMGVSGTVITQVALQKQDRVIGDAKGISLGITYEHALSKRTRIYASTARMWNNDRASFGLAATTAAQSANGAGSNPRVISFGMTHSF